MSDLLAQLNVDLSGMLIVSKPQGSGEIADGTQASVLKPLQACLDAFASTPVATSEVLINVARGSTDPFVLGVRSAETNGGNLIADSFIAAYDRYAESTGLPPRDH